MTSKDKDRKDSFERYPRLLILETDGRAVHVNKCDLTGLEVCELCRRLIKVFGGE